MFECVYIGISLCMLKFLLKTKDDFVNLFIFYFWHTQKNYMLCNGPIVK